MDILKKMIIRRSKSSKTFLYLIFIFELMFCFNSALEAYHNMYVAINSFFAIYFGIVAILDGAAIYTKLSAQN